MVKRKANSEWKGKLKDGEGNMKFGSGAFEGQYSFLSRFKEGKGTNPEELIAAAHSGCFSMALAASLGEEGYDPESVQTEAVVDLQKVDGDFKITTIHLKNHSKVPEIDEEVFQEIAQEAKKNCPVSKALASIDIELAAELKS
ncbi:MAG: OsmC family protein [Candidatus Natronoplasma sp.]